MKQCCLASKHPLAARRLRLLQAPQRFNATMLCSMALTLLVPKCPLCLAAWAAAMGLGAFWPKLLVSSWSVPLLIALLFLPAFIGFIQSRSFNIAKLSWFFIAVSVAEGVSLTR